jgi:hypothetical protein
MTGRMSALTTTAFHLLLPVPFIDEILIFLPHTLDSALPRNINK